MSEVSCVWWGTMVHLASLHILSNNGFQALLLLFSGPIISGPFPPKASCNNAVVRAAKTALVLCIGILRDFGLVRMHRRKSVDDVLASRHNGVYNEFGRKRWDPL